MHAPNLPREVSPDEVADLVQRLRRFRPPPVASGHEDDRGVNLPELADLMSHWAEEYDWPAHERRIRSLPWELAGTRHPLRVVHQRASSRTDTAVVLLHGWPDSVLRFERILPRLRDIDVVVPALPGFPFAAPHPRGGLSSVAMADLVAEAMSDLGYDRFVVSAGDVGCDVAEALAGRHPERVAALHLTDVSQYHFLVDMPEDLSPAEEEYVRFGREWQAREGGYMHEQSTRPNTLSVALADSPAGLAAWILEKLTRWTDCDGDLNNTFTRDEALTWVSAYWFERCIGTSFAPYAEAAAKPWPRIEAPTAFTLFAKDLVNAPREFADRFFRVESWVEHPHGGHFAAWERPDDYVDGVRTAVELARGTSFRG